MGGLYAGSDPIWLVGTIVVACTIVIILDGMAPLIDSYATNHLRARSATDCFSIR